VISAVGHEIDTTLADFAADLRAPTPTAAAEIAVPVHGELSATLTELYARQQRSVLRLVSHARERLAARAERLPQPQALLEGQAQKLDDLGERLTRALGHRTEIAAQVLARHAGALRPALLIQRLAREHERLRAQRLRPEVVLHRIATARERVEALDRLRLQLDPKAPLQRGYVLVTTPDGQVVKDRAGAMIQAALRLEFADGTLDVTPAGALPRSNPRKVTPPPGQQELF
jgi:exodeoxyribonuclease VII large subunit